MGCALALLRGTTLCGLNAGEQSRGAGCKVAGCCSISNFETKFVVAHALPFGGRS